MKKESQIENNSDNDNGVFNTDYLYDEDNDIGTLEQEERTIKTRRLILLLLFLLLFLFLVLGYNCTGRCLFCSGGQIGIDLDGDGICDLNCDTDGDGKCDYNCDFDGDGKCDLNCDDDGDGKCDYNCDLNGDGKCDLNCDDNGDGKCDYNCDTNDDGKCDLNCDDNGDGKCDYNCDTDDDGKCDLNCDDNGDGECDRNCDIDDDGICDVHCDIEIEEGEEYVLRFEDGLEMNQSDIVPGWEGTKTFTIINKTEDTHKFKMEWIQVTNTFTPKNNLYYSVRRNDVVMASELRTPYGDEVMFEEISIPPKESFTFEFTFELRNTDENQDVDKGKIFDGTIKITVY